MGNYSSKEDDLKDESVPTTRMGLVSVPPSVYNTNSSGIGGGGGANGSAGGNSGGGGGSTGGGQAIDQSNYPTGFDDRFNSSTGATVLDDGIY